MDGICGICYEHSAAEGIAVVQLLDKILQQPQIHEPILPKMPQDQFSVPQLLEWNLNNTLIEKIEEAAHNIDK